MAEKNICTKTETFSPNTLLLNPYRKRLVNLSRKRMCIVKVNALWRALCWRTSMAGWLCLKGKKQEGMVGKQPWSHHSEDTDLFLKEDKKPTEDKAECCDLICLKGEFQFTLLPLFHLPCNLQSFISRNISYWIQLLVISDLCIWMVPWILRSQSEAAVWPRAY